MKMKNIIITIIALLTISLASAGVLNHTTGLVAYWSFDNSSDIGNDDYDAKDGTVIGNPTSTKFGREGRAIDLDGTDDYIDLPSLLSRNDYTIAGWFKINATGGTPVQTVIGLFKDQYNGYVAILDNQGGVLEFSMRETGTNDIHAVQSNSKVNNGEWNHFVATKSSTEGLKIYINGILEDTDASATANCISATGFNKISGYHSSSGGSTGHLFNGTIDEIAVWDRVMNASEVSEFYNLHPAETAIPEVNGSKAVQIFVVLIIALLIGAIFMRKK